MSAERSAHLKQSLHGIFPVCAALAVLWVVLVTVANPIGNFPLNDDWNYGRTVHTLLTEHKILITQWSLTASVIHWFVGLLFCLPFGFSFDCLRASSIVLAFVAVMCCYVLCRQLGASRLLASAAALVLMTDPLFFNLSLTFMTDVPFLAFAGVSLIMLTDILIKRRTGLAIGYGEIILATAVTTAACLTRQVGLVIPLGFALVNVACNRPQAAESMGDADSAARKAPVWLAAVLPLVVAGAAVLTFQFWLFREFGTLQCYVVEKAYLQERFSSLVSLLRHTLGAFAQAGIYIGIMVLPILPVVLREFFAKLNKAERTFAIMLIAEFGILMSIGLVFTMSAMPLVDNIFFNFGLGPLTVGLNDVSAPVWPQAPLIAMLALSCLGAFGLSAPLAMAAIAGVRLRKRLPLFDAVGVGAVVGFLLVTLTIFLIINCGRGFFDRYLLVAMMLVLPCLCSVSRLAPGEETAAAAPSAAKPPALAAALSLLLLVPFAAFAVGGTHDYMAWNRARWQALNDLTATVSPMDIDGGLEFNGWSSYDLKYRDHGGVVLGKVPNHRMVHNRVYAVTVSPVDGYEVVKRYPFVRWLPAGEGEVLVLKAKDKPAP